MKSYKILLAGLLLILCSISCKKEDDNFKMSEDGKRLWVLPNWAIVDKNVWKQGVLEIDLDSYTIADGQAVIQLKDSVYASGDSVSVNGKYYAKAVKMAVPDAKNFSLTYYSYKDGVLVPASSGMNDGKSATRVQKFNVKNFYLKQNTLTQPLGGTLDLAGFVNANVVTDLDLTKLFYKDGLGNDIKTADAAAISFTTPGVYTFAVGIKVDLFGGGKALIESVFNPTVNVTVTVQ